MCLVVVPRIEFGRCRPRKRAAVSPGLLPLRGSGAPGGGGRPGGGRTGRRPGSAGARPAERVGLFGRRVEGVDSADWVASFLAVFALLGSLGGFAYTYSKDRLRLKLDVAVSPADQA